MKFPPLNLTSGLFHTRVQRATSQLIQKATYWCRSITATGEVMPLFSIYCNFVLTEQFFSPWLLATSFFTPGGARRKSQILSKPILASTCSTSSQTSLFSLSLHSSHFLLLWPKQLKLYSRYSYYCLNKIDGNIVIKASHIAFPVARVP